MRQSFAPVGPRDVEKSVDEKKEKKTRMWANAQPDGRPAEHRWRLCSTPQSLADVHYYTVNHKKRDILFVTITLANLNRFLYFLHHFNREEILHATVLKFITSL